MNRDCQVTDKGDVYEIQNDGSISKIGNIRSGNNDSFIGLLWAFLIIAIIAIITATVFRVRLHYANKELKHQKYELDDAYLRLFNAEYELDDAYLRLFKAGYELEELKVLKQSLNKSHSLIISDVEIGNLYANGAIETNYGDSIYSSRSMYLAPKIKYVGLTSGYVTLKVKLYYPYPDGTLSKGSSSPYDCSYTNSVYVYSGKNEYSLSSWGGSSMGHWDRGTYRIEIWHKSNCLAVKYFRVY